MLFNSSEARAQMSFSDRYLLIVRRRRRCYRKLFFLHFRLFSLEPLGQF